MFWVIEEGIQFSKLINYSLPVEPWAKEGEKMRKLYLLPFLPTCKLSHLAKKKKKNYCL